MHVFMHDVCVRWCLGLRRSTIERAAPGADDDDDDDDVDDDDDEEDDEEYGEVEVAEVVQCEVVYIAHMHHAVCMVRVEWHDAHHAASVMMMLHHTHHSVSVASHSHQQPRPARVLQVFVFAVCVCDSVCVRSVFVCCM